MKGLKQRLNEARLPKDKNVEVDFDSYDYYVRYSDHIEDDLKRAWSSWNFGEGGFKGKRMMLLNTLNLKIKKMLKFLELNFG